MESPHSHRSISGVIATQAAAKPPRDHRIDLLRGFALATIFVNHMPGNWIGHWTPRNFGFSDAAELFVLLAGYAAALAYSGLFQRKDFWGLSIKAVRRAGVLYGAHIITTLAAIALFWAVLAGSSEGTALDLVGAGPVFVDPASSLMAVFTGGFQLSYFNILPMYVVLLLALPAMFWLASRDLRLLGVVSAGAYLGANLAGLALPSARSYESWFFNPLAWQVLFAGGLVLGTGRCRGKAVEFHRGLFIVAAGYLAFAAVWTVDCYGCQIGEGVLPGWAGSLQKPNLPLPRLLHIAALAYVITQSRVWVWLARMPKDFVLTRMGRHSLPVFMAGSLLSMTGWIVATWWGGGIAVETAVFIVGLALMATQARWLDGDLKIGAGLPIAVFGRRVSAVVAVAS